MTGAEGGGRVAIDWAQLRARLDVAIEGQAGIGSAQTSEEDHRLLDARALTLATPQLDTSGESTRGVLVFRRGPERFALDMTTLLQVHRPRSLTPLPGADHPVLALVAWRGRVLTVVDVGGSASDAVSATAMAATARVLVVEHSSGAFGILADDVLEVRSLGDDDMLPLPNGVSGRTHSTEGVTHDAVTLVDAEMLANRIANPMQRR